MAANPPDDPIAGLPAALADRLADVLYRAVDATARAAGLQRLVDAHPEHAAALRAAAASPAGATAADAAADAVDAPLTPVGEAIGPFRVLGLLGRGGYGEVYLAEQSAPVRRRVALKVLKRGMDSGAILRRFAREQQVLARMNHDGIARLLDAGMAPGGQPYFAMELVEGLPIVAHCAEHGLGLRARLCLFVGVCKAAQHAHQKGVLHRDLKSSNVLVSRVGGVDAPKLIDFGIARALQDDGDDGLTATGTLVGTVANMAPEQLLRAAGDVDTRTDVYALGLLLYELLAGVPPLAAALHGARSPMDAQRRVLAAEVGRPSAAVGAPDRPEASWRHRLAGDLDWIVLKATAREPDRRYAGAAELAQDLELHLAGMPVHAGPPGAGYRLAKFVRRHRAGVLAAALVLATAVVGAAWTVRFALLADERAIDNARLATDARESAARLAAKVREFQQLAGVVKVAQAKAAEPALYPAAPARVAALQAWLDGPAAELLALRAGVAEALADLRRAALPWPADEQASDRASHPQLGELALAERRRDALRRQAALAGGGELVVPELPAVDAARSSGELMKLARLRTGVPRMGRSIYGEEALGLAYARAAVAKVAGDNDGIDEQWALAWALAENGQDAEARALADATAAQGSKSLDPDQTTSAKLHADLHAAIRGRGEALAAAEAEVERLAAVVGARQTWRFPPELQAEAFLHDTLVRLAADVDAFEALEVRNARARLRWALAVRDDGLTAAHPGAVTTWDDVAAYLRTAAAYRGAGAIVWDEEAALDLVPLGPNPATGLLEFYHLASAWDGEADPRQLPIPRHAPDGRIPVTSATGIVFVLLPGGVTRLGSQGDDPSAPYYDPAHVADETLHAVDLAPYLIARHEVTQGQWQRLTAWAPALRRPATYNRAGSVAGVNITDAHPVERVTFAQAEEALQRAGLQLPTEAQWEHACRAGTTTPWHAPEAELRHHANFADAATKKVAPSWNCLPWNDGHGVHAPVGTFLPNAWGLFDMHGNVAELVRDPDGPYGSERPGDGLRTAPGAFSRRFHRGGNWTSLPATSRTAMRMTTRSDANDHSVGLRACRSLRRAGG